MSPSPHWPHQPYLPVHSYLPVSTIPPLDENELGSMDFELWREIGSELLIKSTVNNWLICSENGGSLVEWRQGLITCNVTKVNVERDCEAALPFTFEMHTYSPGFHSQNGFYYNFYTRASHHWSISDPCGASSQNQLSNVLNPGLWMYARERDPYIPDVNKIFDENNGSSKYHINVLLIYEKSMNILLKHMINANFTLQQ